MAKPTELSPAEIIAAELTKISDAMRLIRLSGLKRKTVVVLVAHSTGLPQRDVLSVLESLDDLRADWCNP